MNSALQFRANGSYQYGRSKGPASGRFVSMLFGRYHYEGLFLFHSRNERAGLGIDAIMGSYFMTEPEQDPYRTPGTVGFVPPELLTEGEPLKDPRTLGWLSVTFLWLFCVSGVIELMMPGPESVIVNGVHVDVAAADSDLTQLISVGKGLSFFAVMVVFLMWTYRCATNARRLNGRKLNLSPGLAVGSYFIPIYNFIGPVTAMNEIVRITYQHSPRRKVSGVVLFGWWLSWIAFNFLSRGASISQPSFQFYVISMGISALLLTVLIVKLSAAQAEIVVAPAPPSFADLPRRAARSPLRGSKVPSRLPAVEAGLPVDVPFRPKPEPVNIPKRPPPGPHPNAPAPRRPDVTPADED